MPRPANPKNCPIENSPRVHQVEANDGVGEQSYRDDARVLEQDVHRVLGLGQSDFQEGEPQVHHEDQQRGNEHPRVVDGEHRFSRGLCRRRSGRDRNVQQRKYEK